ncbi:MAG: hypothetical protein LAQ30_02150 [Acidobacteriia bacterium]|nr:hypothetical protein [Terriglobia bacterium]
MLGILIASSGGARGQGYLSLTPGTVSADGSATLTLNLTSPGGAAPAAIQWELTYSRADVVSMSAVTGDSAATAGKSIYCTGRRGSYLCLLAGLNVGIIRDGVAAVVKVAMAPGVSSTAIGVTGVLGAGWYGDSLAVSGVGGVVTPALSAPAALAALACSPTSLGPGESAKCTASVSGEGGATITLASDEAALTAPPAVAVQAGSTAATFMAAAGTIASDRQAAITATLNGRSLTLPISLVVPPKVAGLTCNPATLAAGANAMCAVTLSKAAGAGGAAVALSSSASALSIPPSITVEAGGTTRTFGATAGAVAADLTATITATLNGSSVAASIVLGTPPSLGAFWCAPTSIASGKTSTCTVTLSKAAGQGGIRVALSHAASVLTAADSVTVPAGSLTASFPVTAGTVAQNQTTALTASLNGNSMPVFLTALAGSPLLQQMACAPAVLGPGMSAICTITLSQPAGEGVRIFVSSNTTLLEVPLRVSVPGGLTSSNFTVTAGDLAASQTAVITANLAGVTQAASIFLVVSGTELRP